VDTCVGDNKPREARPSWHPQQLGTFLPLLAKAGVTPQDVDYVFCTHMHGDGRRTRVRRATRAVG